MRRLIILVLAALLVISLLCACQLAKPDAGMDTGRDMLCGVFITLEHLDVGEPDISLNLKGEPQVTFPDARIYATRTENETGFPDYNFDGIEGYRFFVVKAIPKGGTEMAAGSILDNSIQDASTYFSDNDIRLSGTIYFDVACPKFLIFPNPVYQTRDGRVYMLPATGTGVYTSKDGDCFSVSLSDTATQTADGETTTKTMEVQIAAKCLNTNREIRLKQMDEHNHPLYETVITQESIPDSIRVMKDTAYMILEEHAMDGEGNAVVKRTLIYTSEEYFNVQFTGEHNIVVPSVVTLEH